MVEPYHFVNVAGRMQDAYEGVNALRQDRARKAAGQAMARDDYKGAAGELMTAGLPEEGARLARFSEVRAAEADKAKADQRAETWKYFGDMAGRLMQLNQQQDDPEGTVAAFDTFFAKGLRDRGETEEEIAAVRAQLGTNPGQALRMLGAAAQDQLEIVKGSDGMTYTAVDTKTGRPVYNQTGPRKPDWKERTRADGSTEWFDLNAEGGDDPPQGSAPRLSAPSGGAKPAGNSQPRNVRNNNPGNIKDGKFAQSLPGYAGSDGTFAIFDSRDAGHNAQVSLLQSYGNRGLNTVKAIIERWAPPSDNNPTTDYVDFVARKLGVSPREALNMADPQVVSGLAAAIQQFEGGGPAQPYKVAALGDTPPPPSGGRSVRGDAPKPKEGYRTLAAEEVAQLGLPGDGIYQMGPNGQVSAIRQPRNNEKPTDGMKRNVALTHRMLDANDRLNAVIQSGVTRPSYWKLVSEGGGPGRLELRNADDRRFVGAAKEWLAPILRKDTGAAVNDQEFLFYADTYIPAPGDSPAVLRQKAEARQSAMVAMVGEAGPLYTQTHGKREFRSRWAPEAASGPPADAIEHLRKNPNLRAAFDAKYGPGASAKALGK